MTAPAYTSTPPPLPTAPPPAEGPRLPTPDEVLDWLWRITTPPPHVTEPLTAITGGFIPPPQPER
jgi:hypothetical protein